MKKLIPFKKEIDLGNLYEVTSISLEHNLSKKDNVVSGNFIVSGEYLTTETSKDTIPFNYDIPFTIDIDNMYDISNASIDIDDFYYEIINNKILSINIEVKLDKVEELLLEREAIMDNVDLLSDNTIDLDVTDNNIEINNYNDVVIEDKDIKKSLFSNLDNTDNYVNYRVYIVRENDSIESIMKKYNVTKNILEDYNDLNNMKIGDKIIIPYVKD
nr:LysM peptidoglycan-binding domain-containing protein [Bacilli bacterium]